MLPVQDVRLHWAKDPRDAYMHVNVFACCVFLYTVGEGKGCSVWFIELPQCNCL